MTDLLDMLPVTEFSTTSRVVVDNAALRVVVFAFDIGELLTEHSMAPGDVIYLAPGQAHALVADAPSHLSLVMVDVDAISAAAATSAPDLICSGCEPVRPPEGQAARHTVVVCGKPHQNDSPTTESRAWLVHAPPPACIL